MSPNVCTNKLGGVQFTVMAKICRLHNLGGHVGGEARDGACLVIRHDSWAHLPIGMQTVTTLCSIILIGNPMVPSN